jgi:hypothetical protein
MTTTFIWRVSGVRMAPGRGYVRAGQPRVRAEFRMVSQPQAYVSWATNWSQELVLLTQPQTRIRWLRPPDLRHRTTLECTTDLQIC